MQTGAAKLTDFILSDSLSSDNRHMFISSKSVSGTWQLLNAQAENGYCLPQHKFIMLSLDWKVSSSLSNAQHTTGNQSEFSCFGIYNHTFFRVLQTNLVSFLLNRKRIWWKFMSPRWRLTARGDTWFLESNIRSQWDWDHQSHKILPTQIIPT